ncbi:MAG: histidine--tRNA ligase [Spirochaetales bacterium]|nr:histidine--tRNA ligase [Spirochaetales bacterium]
MIEPKVLKGFKDSLPQEEFYRKYLISKIEDNLKLYGYLPIDTPTLEYKEILLGKGGGETDKQVFIFKDKGDREVGLRYDLTVPLARFIAMHENEIVFPFKRYHIAKAWRGEKPQRGRFREFYQADFDIIGIDSIESDIEIISLIYNLLKNLGIDNITIKINDRSLMHQIFKKIGISNYEKEILLILDKYYKIPEKEFIENLKNIIGDKSEEILRITKFENRENLFDFLKDRYDIYSTRLEKVIDFFKQINLQEFVTIDFTITRGLDYYTGIVFETFIKDYVELGSVCSGGRYDNLTSIFSKNKYSGIGSSIGLDRLISYLFEKNLIPKVSFCNLLIANLNPSDLGLYYKILNKMHSSQISCEIYPEATKLKKQFKYSEDKNIPFILFLGEEEKEKSILKLKNIDTGKEIVFSTIEKLIDYLKNPQNSTSL